MPLACHLSSAIYVSSVSIFYPLRQPLLLVVVGPSKIDL